MAYFALVQFELWNEQDVAAWLKGLDDVVHQYIPTFVEERVDGKKLLMLTHSDLDKLEVTKLGHQELILEGVDLLKSLRYTFETENLQHLALQLGCKARSLHNEILAKNSENDPNRANILPSRHHRRQLSISVLSSTCDIMTTLKTLTSWLDRSPFEGIYDINLLRNSIVKLGLEMVTVAQRESGVTEVENIIVKTCKDLTEYCDSLVLNMKESLVVQPASLEIATIRKKQDDELGMNILSSYLGVHVIGFIKDMSPADLCSRIEKGDEVIQVNNQTVLGWQLAKLVAALRERPKEVTMLLKKRPRHTNPFGNVPNKRQPRHIPSVATLPKALKKRRSRDGDKPARPTLQVYVTSSVPTGDVYIKEPPEDNNDGNDTDNEVFRSGSESPQFTLPVTVDAKQRRATVSGGSPTFERPSLVVEDLDPPPVRPKSQAINLLEREAVIASLLAAENSLMKKTSGEKDKGERANTSSSENKDVSTSTSSTLKDEDGASTSDEIDGSNLRTEEPKENENTRVETERVDMETNFIVTKPIPRESSSAQKSWNRHQRIVSTEVAGDTPMKGDIPQLMRIKRLDSSQISDLEAKVEDDVFMKPSKKVGFSEETAEPEKSESYTHIVVGGVVQKIPLDKAGSNSSDSTVKMRNKSSGGKRLDRRVSCKDLGKGDCEGWLYKRRHKDRTLSKHWAKRWCVLKNFNLFFYKQKDDLKAEGVIHLPAFQVSPAPNLKTKKFAFKIHNSGTTFYFGSERQEDMSKWMNKMGLAAINYDASKDVTTGGFIKPERQQNPPLGVRNVYYSESEDDDETADRWQGSAMSLASSSSVGSMQSPQSSPVVKRHALKDVKERVGASTEELQSMLHSIQKQDLTIDGKDKKALRQSQCKAASDIGGDSVIEVERLRRLQSLQRTLRAKEQELQDIDKLMSETVTSSKLVQFVDTHQEADAAD